VVAFVLSFAIAVIGTFGAVLWYGKRRPVGAPLTWGAAMLASTLVFALMFWAYGVVPHQWLTYAGNELSWRPDKGLVGPFEINGEPVFEFLLPFSLNYEVVSHTVVVLIYGFFLGLHIWAFMAWQNRAKEKPLALPTSEYGRPLVRQG
jgi:hypothetical protein